MIWTFFFLMVLEHLVELSYVYLRVIDLAIYLLEQFSGLL